MVANPLAPFFPASWPIDLLNVFCVLALVLGALSALKALRTASDTSEGITAADAKKLATFSGFQREYLAVYLIIMLADWLQGTNMYTLYSGYGVSVSALFLTGFSSSLVFGTFVGLLVDSHGRKRACVLFCVLEVVINLLEHVPSMPLLLLGRVLGGISTSLLFSAFEAWMVAEHRRRGYPDRWLAKTFSLAAAGNGAVAVFAGLLAQVAADARGDIGPFQAAIALTVVVLALVLRWPENYGADDVGAGVVASVGASLRTAAAAIAGDRRVALLAAVSALFEGATFTFVFMWVPALIDARDGSLPTGLVFASFMVAITIGGVVYGLLVGDDVASGRVERVALGCLACAAGCMAIPFLSADATRFLPRLAPALATFDASLYAFLGLEVCVGCFGGCAATMRARYIPDDVQGAVMNLSRVPLNVLVVAGTTMADFAPQQLAFLAVSATFAMGALVQIGLLDDGAPAGSEAERAPAKRTDGAAPPSPRRSGRIAAKAKKSD